MATSVLLTTSAFVKKIGFSALYAVNSLPRDDLLFMDKKARDAEETLLMDFCAYLKRRGISPGQQSLIARAIKKNDAEMAKALTPVFAPVPKVPQTPSSSVASTPSRLFTRENIDRQMVWESESEGEIKESVKRINSPDPLVQNPLRKIALSVDFDEVIVISDDDDIDAAVSWEQKFWELKKEKEVQEKEYLKTQGELEKECKFWEIKYRDSRSLLEKAVAKINKMKARFLAR